MNFIYIFEEISLPDSTWWTHLHNKNKFWFHVSTNYPFNLFCEWKCNL